MSGRRGFSLVEMVIVLVLAGIVSTAAITMFSTQNRLNAQMTALGESQENARSAVMLAASELHGATAGAVIDAGASSLTLRLPVVVGVVCGEQNGPFRSVYFPLDGVDLDASEIDGYALADASGAWTDAGAFRNPNQFNPGARQFCIDAGGGAAGQDADYARMRLIGSSVGTPVMLYREVRYYLAPSALDSSRRGFFRATDGQAVELAHGFTDDSRFEYQLADTAWSSSVRNPDLANIEGVRLVVEVQGEGTSGSASGSASFALVREIQLRNVR
ncbi:MAG TPA: type II secretion system protein [Longimicrobiales bacterium]